MAESTLCSTCLDEVHAAQLPAQLPLPLLDSMECWLDFDAKPIQHLLHQAKFGQQPEVAYRLGQLYAATHSPPHVDALVPAPLSFRRQWTRGYNQCDWIVRGLAQEWQLPVWRALRKKHRPPQAKMQLEDRSKSAHDAYWLAKSLPAGCRVQLWDDTLTTGATLQSMAAVLYRGGASEVHGATLARAE